VIYRLKQGGCCPSEITKACGYGSPRAAFAKASAAQHFSPGKALA
jgi:hypothetical protein